MTERLALVHDYLTQRGGAERVVASWCRGFPDAPLYSALYEPATTFEDFADAKVRTSWLNALGPLRRHHRWALPLLAPTMSTWRIDADVVLASSSGWAHGVRTSGRLVVYCHAPARWLYQRERYLADGAMGSRTDLVTRLLTPALRRWDHAAATRADTYIVNSRATREFVRAVYGRDAHVVAPPVTVPAVLPGSGPESDVLVVARLLAYKNVDLAIEVARTLPALRFRIIGDGPLRRRLQADAPPNVAFAGAVSEEELWRSYVGTRVHLALSHEDFGITPLEAAAARRPSVARASGGYLDTITTTTGILIDEDDMSVRRVAGALGDALSRTWDLDVLAVHAATFSEAAHLARIHDVMDA